MTIIDVVLLLAVAGLLRVCWHQAQRQRETERDLGILAESIKLTADAVKKLLEEHPLTQIERAIFAQIAEDLDDEESDVPATRH